MKLENQVCTLEQAKKLFELGVLLQSEHSWCWNGSFYQKNGSKGYFLNRNGFTIDWAEQYCAYTVAELMQMLNQGYYCVKTVNGKWGVSHVSENWLITVHNQEDADEVLYGEHDTMAVALADAVIKQTGWHMTVVDVNSRLQSA